MKRELNKFLNKQLGYDFLINADLKEHCWYRIGGPADYVVYPKDDLQLSEILQACLDSNEPYFILGSGANLLISDNGFRGVIIKLTRYFNKIELEGNTVTVGAGVNLDRLVLFCEENGLAGVAELAGIPGTLGGALTMNAGTDKGVISDVVVDVNLLDPKLNCMTYKNEQIGFGYRTATLLQDKVICGCRLKLIAGDRQELQEIRLSQLKIRKEKQPLQYPSCGSVFKRPPGNYAGKLIEEAGLKGFRYGNAQISEKHAGFIVNLGNAKASDVKFLIDKIEEEVFEQFSIRLEPEVRLLGF
ncbi:UDP-N-acetylmuramate dehydrogenase [Candidatus Cloacimonadota bacterium]